MKTISPNDLGNNLVSENCQKISINSLMSEVRKELKVAILQTKLEVMGINVEITSTPTRYKGSRLWFKCPQCNSRVGILFQNPLNGLLGCRLCTGVVYRKQRFKGMLEENTKNLQM